MSRRTVAAGIVTGSWAHVRLDDALGTPEDAYASAAALLAARRAEEAAAITVVTAAAWRPQDLHKAGNDDDGTGEAA